MIHKALRHGSLVILAASGLAHAHNSDVAYSQNNLPSQHQVSGYLAKDHPILFNADLLIGRIQGSPTNYGQRYTDDGSDNITQETFDFPNGTHVGFRFGLGIGLRNDVNLSVQWTRISDNNHESRSFAAVGLARTFNVQMPYNVDDSAYVLSDAAKLTAFQDQKYQTVDLLVQTAAWMLNSNTRFQPFGGIRYLEYTRDLCSKLLNTNTDEFANATSHFRIRSTGVLIGTDIKYLFSKHFFFFSNFTFGIVGGYHKRDYSAESDLNAAVTSTWKFHERFRLSFDPMYELRFGFAFETLINKQWILSIRVSYELASLIQTSAQSINPFGSLSSAGPVFPLRTNDVVKTQLFLVGFTVGF
ncbi:MAG: hypothetical protein K940chlam8_00854 [Chlamydiae bacterium]|nr:hypothetical protein [Chlamydiota bacterium]